MRRPHARSVVDHDAGQGRTVFTNQRFANTVSVVVHRGDGQPAHPGHARRRDHLRLPQLAAERWAAGDGYLRDADHRQTKGLGDAGADRRGRAAGAEDRRRGEAAGAGRVGEVQRELARAGADGAKHHLGPVGRNPSLASTIANASCTRSPAECASAPRGSGRSATTRAVRVRRSSGPSGVRPRGPRPEDLRAGTGGCGPAGNPARIR